ncbi:MAG: amino acid permease [Oscillospiraceae bacterium]|nr:amino acid permease [Oscillospiraceae bacterium]
MFTNAKHTEAGLTPYLSPAAAWALALGTSVGWGSLVVTSNTYLAQAGPLGSLFGLLIGMVVMLVICRNIHYMATCYPDAGGVYSYTKYVFGYDRGFLISWFLSLTYIAMFWANATALPLFVWNFFGDVLRFGRLYTLFGYEVYLGEALLSMGAVALVALFCTRTKRGVAAVMVTLVVVFIVGITVCAVAALVQHKGGIPALEPGFVPDSDAIGQIVRIACISPWAFVGFENISHSAGEFTFSRRKIMRVLTVAVITATALYLLVTLLSITAFPDRYDNWLAYIRDLDNCTGLEGLPAFYAAQHYLGSAGVVILSMALLALVITSLIGNIVALSRLFYTLAKDSILPSRLAHLNRKHIPSKAIWLIALISLAIPFVGRTAIGWIVDVTTIGAVLIYGFVSAAAFKTARKTGDRRETVTGAFGFWIMIALGAYLLIPSLFGKDMLATETFLLFIIWSILGFIYFRSIIRRDHARRFGKAIIVWIVLLALIVFMAMVWMGRIDESATSEAVLRIRDYYAGALDPALYQLGEEAFIAQTLQKLHNTDTLSTFAMIGLFAMALAIMLSNHFSMRKWEQEAVEERDAARTIAYTDPLTGVKSKHAFVETEHELDKRIDSGEGAPFAVLVCDVNGLKHINDTQGHKAGDRYICDAAELICEHFKHSPVYRIGGDEFVVVPNGPDFDNRAQIIGVINEKIEANIGTDNVVISLGLSELTETDRTFHAVFERADNLMYKRKQQLKAMGARTRE